MGDFCMSPSVNLEFFLSSEKIENFVTFYSSCSDGDESPYLPYVTLAYYHSNILSNYMTNLQDSCPYDNDVVDAVALSQNIANNVMLLDDGTKCSTIRTALYRALNHSICSHTYNGFFIIWICYIIIILSLYFTAAVTCLLFEYLDTKYWALDQTNPVIIPKISVDSNPSNRTKRRKISMIAYTEKKLAENSKIQRINNIHSFGSTATTSPFCSDAPYEQIENGNCIHNATVDNDENILKNDENKNDIDTDKDESQRKKCKYNDNNNNNNYKSNNNCSDDHYHKFKKMNPNELKTSQIKEINFSCSPVPISQLKSISRSVPTTDSVTEAAPYSSVQVPKAPRSV